MATESGAPHGASVSQLDTLSLVLDLIRSGTARTRSDVGRASGLGRAVVAQRVSELISLGLVEEAGFAPPQGGRAARELQFRANCGYLLVAELGATGLGAGLSDLSGVMLARYEEPIDVSAGPDKVLRRVEELFDQLVADNASDGVRLWGIGIGLPAPVEFASGRPVAPPIMPGWDGYPVRDRFAERYDVAVWVDNEVNLLALGELLSGRGKGVEHLVYLKIGTGIGAGLISGGRLHRGAQGAAGDIGHVAVGNGSAVICRCGNTGCLEAYAGGAALAREGQLAAEEGRSRHLAQVRAAGHTISATDIIRAAGHGDAFSVELLSRVGRLIGESLATIVNVFNPSLILIGGGVSQAGDNLLAAVRETVFSRSLPLATRDLRVVRASLDEGGGLIGAAFMVINELFRRERLALWIEAGTPVGRPDLVHVR